MRSIDIAAEFNRLGIEFSTVGEDLKILCPFHDDQHPSCSVSRTTQKFICRACQVGGDIFTLIAKITGKPRHIVLAQLTSKDDKPVEVSVIERDHKSIWTATEFLTQLRKRGLSDDTLRRFFIGENNGRITIPIANSEGMFVNIRKYLPGAKGDIPKMTNQKGRSQLRLYPFSQLQYENIVICAGEIKALAVAQRLNVYGIGAICVTGGENAWNQEFNNYFVGKKVWILGDIDEAGVKAAERKCIQLKHIAYWLGKIVLPLNINEYPTGDVNDFIEANEFDIDGNKLLTLLKSTDKWAASKTIIPYDVSQDGEVREVTIREAMLPHMVMRRFASKVVVSAIGQDYYYIPKMVRPSCTKDQSSCGVCPLFDLPDNPEVQVPPESKVVLAMMETDIKTQDEEIKLGLQVPPCEVVTFEVLNNYKVCEARLQREMTLVQPDSDKTVVAAVLIDQDPELNETYAMTGKAMPHPRTQRCVAMISQSEAVTDALSGFKLNEPEELLIFRPDDWTVESIQQRLDTFYRELAVNVTKIYDRQPMHQIIDLAYHSVLGMNVAGKTRKAWVEVLIVGDSEQGKSDVVDNLSAFYGLGEKVDCKNATRAGLLGGSIEVAGKWWVQWGVIPKNDRRLVILEELKGLSSEVFARLTEMRSSGMAEIPQITRGKAPARTRLVALSNPRNSHNLDSYSYGVNAIIELIGSPEDIRRFDICAIIHRNEIETRLVTEDRNPIEPTFTSDQCRRLILWCWTRRLDEVVFMDGTVEMATLEANLLCDDFTDAVPILGRAGTKLKLLRLAAALAGRLFSCDAEYTTLLVRPCHVQWVAQFLRSEYSKQSHGYLELSSRGKRQETLVDIQQVRAQFEVIANQTTVVERLLYTDTFDQQDVRNWCGWSREEAELFISILVRNNAIQRDGTIYRKIPAFSKFLRELLSNPIKIPAHILSEKAEKEGAGKVY